MLDLPIFITGFMGAGKSKIGSLLALRLKRAFLDTDQMIEERAGKTISEIFAEEGEEHFRRIEQECVKTAASRRDAVISLGGGAVTRQHNLDLVQKEGVLVCIEADVETILDRVSRREDRPLLAGLSQEKKRAKIEEMLAARAPFYARADIKVQSSDGQPPRKTMEILLESLEKWHADH